MEKDVGPSYNDDGQYLLMSQVFLSSHTVKADPPHPWAGSVYYIWDQNLSSLCLHIDGLMQKRPNPIANALELRLFCIKPLICNIDLSPIKSLETQFDIS